MKGNYKERFMAWCPACDMRLVQKGFKCPKCGFRWTAVKTRKQIERLTRHEYEQYLNDQAFSFYDEMELAKYDIDLDDFEEWSEVVLENEDIFDEYTPYYWTRNPSDHLPENWLIDGLHR